MENCLVSLEGFVDHIDAFRDEVQSAEKSLNLKKILPIFELDLPYDVVNWFLKFHIASLSLNGKLFSEFGGLCRPHWCFQRLSSK